MSVTVMGSPEQRYVRPSKLRSGQLAVVRQSSIVPGMAGEVVQRINNQLVLVGKDCIWENVNAMTSSYWELEPLRNGTLLRVEDNE